MYKKASKLKLRFTTNKGLLTIEQLWDLSLSDLVNSIKLVNTELNKQESTILDFIESSIEKDPVNQLRFDILKDIYLTKKTEIENQKEAINIKRHNQKILELIESKKESVLQNMPIEELEKLLK